MGQAEIVSSGQGGSGLAGDRADHFQWEAPLAVEDIGKGVPFDALAEEVAVLGRVEVNLMDGFNVLVAEGGQLSKELFVPIGH